MPAQTITPKLWLPTTSIAEITGTAVPAGEEWSVDVRVTNVSASEVLYRLLFGPDGNVANGLHRHYDIKIPPNESRDVELKLLLPAGWRLFDRASANSALHVSVTARKRTTA